MELRAEVVLGVMANKFVKEIKSQTSIQKYNETTGEPYFINKNEIKYELNGKQYSADELDDFLADRNLNFFPV